MRPLFSNASPRARWLMKWSALTVVAVVLGGLLGSGYAVMTMDYSSDSTLRATGEVAAIPPPITPEPLAPGDRDVVMTLTPEFEWTSGSSGYFTVYNLEVSTDPEFGFGIITTVEKLIETRWLVPDEFAFPPGVPHYWRVMSEDYTGQQSEWSEVSMFIPVGLPPLPEDLPGVPHAAHGDGTLTATLLRHA